MTDSTIPLGNGAAPESQARQLAYYLHNGGPLQTYDPQSAPFRVRPDESVHAAVDVVQQQFTALGDGSYIKTTYVPTSVTGAIFRMGTAAANSHRKAQAAALAQERWHAVDGGMLFITNQRLVMQLSRSWDVVEFGWIMATSFDGEAVYLEINGRETIRLLMSAADYHFVMLHYLVNGQAILLPA